jgi:light-regulated signal transduction histidine kinase (bacteriophytochrome)
VSEHHVDLVRPDEPIGLDNCAREPIHIPGSIQPRGVLLTVRERDGLVLQCSANVASLLATPVEDVLGRPLDSVLGLSASRVVTDQLVSVPDTRVRNPGLMQVEVAGRVVAMDVVVHRPPGSDGAASAGVVVVELEPADGVRPLTFGTTYEGVRDAIADLNRSSTLTDLYDSAAQHVRRMTGFDRVMVYRFDAEHNGQVVGEARRGDLEPFLGLHYPASDIPPQARAMYERSWIRLISDVDYQPVPILPTAEPSTGMPLDLTFATLRSVSPIHLEYLGNMGVRASMSISLLRDGHLWGMIACHHYTGPHAPPYGVRAAAEFLGVALSARLVAQVDQDLLEESRRAAAILARLFAVGSDEDVPLADALTATDDLRALVPADGVVVLAGGVLVSRGSVPDEAGCRALIAWAGRTDGVHATDRLGTGLDEPGVPGVAGALALGLPEGQAVVWVRDEVLRTVDWGGDPRSKDARSHDDGSVRLSPRTSFALWREQVRGRSEPWAHEHVTAAGDLRPHLLEALYRRGRREVRAAQVVQRSLLPRTLPQVDGWRVAAHYAPSDVGEVGGDWYDALRLPDGRLALAVGDVTGHGLPAAAAMGQLRNATRAYLLDGSPPGAVLGRLGALARWTLPGQMATVVLLVLDPATGTYVYTTAGHLPPLVLSEDGPGRWDPLRPSPLIGLLDGDTLETTGALAAGDALLLMSDGLIERRGESLRIAMGRAATALHPPTKTCGLTDLVAAVRDPASDDDATVVLLSRDRAAFRTT